MRKLTAVVFILLLLLTACNRSTPAPDPVPDQPNSPQGPNNPKPSIPDPGLHPGEPDPEDPPVPGPEDSGLSAEEALSQDIPVDPAPLPADVAESGFETDMAGWVLPAPESWEKPMLHQGNLYFIDYSRITTVALENGETLWTRKFPQGYQLFLENHYDISLSGDTLDFPVQKLPYSGADEIYWERRSADTGTLVWTGRDYSAKYYQDHYYTLTEGNILAQHKHSGEKVWETELSAILSNLYIANPEWNYQGTTLFIMDSVLSAVNSADGAVLWQYDGSIKGFLDGHIVLGNNDRQEIVVADINSGEFLTQLSYSDPETDAFVWNGQLYIKDSESLTRKDPATGKDLWKLEMPGEINHYKRVSWEGIDTLWCFADSDDPILYAINSETGEILQNYNPVGTYYIIVIRIARDLQGRGYVCLNDYDMDPGQYIVFDAQTGEIVWRITHEGSVFESNSSDHLVLVTKTEPIEVKYFNLTTGKIDFQSKIPGQAILRHGDGILCETEDKVMFLQPPWN